MTSRQERMWKNVYILPEESSRTHLNNEQLAAYALSIRTDFLHVNNNRNMNRIDPFPCTRNSLLTTTRPHYSRSLAPSSTRLDTLCY